jgi:hypothetical protein
MKHCLMICACWIASVLSTGLLGFSAERERHPRSPLDRVTALERPVTFSETKIPLGELVRKVANETGSALAASQEVADEPVAVVVRNMEARRLLEQVADLLDYQWSRRGQAGAWRYEIGQDAAARQREEALREAALAAVERRLERQVRQAAEMASLLLVSPISRALTRLLGHLTPEQWRLLREGHSLTFSTEPEPDERPLPAEIARALRNPRPRIRGEWESASGYRASVWLDTSQFRQFLSALRAPRPRPHQPPPPDLTQWTAGSLSLSSERLLQVHEMRGTAGGTRWVPLTPPPAGTRRDAVSRPVLPMHARLPVRGRRDPVTRVVFRLQYGPEQFTSVALDAASPPWLEDEM